MNALQLRITQIIQETEDTKSFYLQPVDKKNIKFKSGQFLTLIFNYHHKEVRRSYSLGSAALIDDGLFITVKRKINGEISRHLLDHYKVGDTVMSLAPSGRFIIYEPTAPLYFFIAAGSGITPVFAMIKELLFQHASTKVILINQCRNERHVIYQNALSSLQKRFEDRLDILQLFSKPLSRGHRPVHLTNELLTDIIQQKVLTIKGADQCQFYICGPLSFMRMAEFTLKFLRFSSNQIRKEHFIIDKPPRLPFVADTSAKQVTIHLYKKTHHFSVAYPATILDAALHVGIQLPYSCKGGRCSTCSAFCISGKVVMSMNEVLTEKDLASGMVLTCVGYAATDLELSID